MSYAWYQVDDFNNYFGVSELESYKGSDASYLTSKRTAALDKLKQDKVANQGDLIEAQKLPPSLATSPAGQLSSRRKS
jgi:hypothetical protein